MGTTWPTATPLLLELVEGVTLADRLSSRTHRAPIEDVLSWLQQACEGLAEAHRMSIVHRDVTPANILVTSAGSVKVIDFGAAKLRWGVKTTSEQRLGAAMYMAPEATRGAAAHPTMDVYSMGLVVHEVVAGVHPMGDTARNMISVVSWQLHGRPRPLREVAPEAPPDLEAIVLAAVEKDPALRLPTIRALADGLREVQARLRAPLRRSARNLPPASHEVSLAPTVPMPVYDGAPPTADRPALPAPPPPETGDRAALVPLPSSSIVVSGRPCSAPVAATPPISAAPTQRSGGWPAARSCPRPPRRPLRSDKPAVPAPNPAWPSGKPAVPAPNPAWPSGKPAVPAPNPAWPSGKPAGPPGLPGGHATCPAALAGRAGRNRIGHKDFCLREGTREQASDGGGERTEWVGPRPAGARRAE